MIAKQIMIKSIADILRNEGYHYTQKMIKLAFPGKCNPALYGVYNHISPGNTHNARVAIERRLATYGGSQPVVGGDKPPTVATKPAKKIFRYKCTNCGAFEHSGGASQCPSCGEPYFAK